MLETDNQPRATPHGRCIATRELFFENQLMHPPPRDAQGAEVISITRSLTLLCEYSMYVVVALSLISNLPRGQCSVYSDIVRKE
jgi:hypothetical protein